MNYSYENTVLVWIDDTSILDMVKKVCSSLKLNIYELEVMTDLIGMPYFFAVIDGSKLTKDILDDIEEFIKCENAKEFAILLTKDTDSKIPASIKKYFIPPIDVIVYDWIKTKIFNKHFALLRHKKNERSYDKTIFRVVYIIRNLMKNENVLYMDDLCREFNVTERTIRRDIALLESMGEDICYDRSKKGYYLKFSMLEITTDNS
jgi:hypothetical protein